MTGRRVSIRGIVFLPAPSLIPAASFALEFHRAQYNDSAPLELRHCELFDMTL